MTPMIFRIIILSIVVLGVFAIAVLSNYWLDYCEKNGLSKCPDCENEDRRLKDL